MILTNDKFPLLHVHVYIYIRKIVTKVSRLFAQLYEVSGYYAKNIQFFSAKMSSIMSGFSYFKKAPERFSIIEYALLVLFK